MKTHTLFAAIALMTVANSGQVLAQTAPLKLFAPPEGAEQMQAKNLSILVNGQNSFVYDLLTRGGTYCNAVGHCINTVPTEFTYFEMQQQSVAIDVDFGSFNIASAKVDPQRAGITPAITGHKIHFTISKPGHYLIRVKGSGEMPPPVAIFANPPESNVPSSSDPKVTFFKAGKIYDAGLMSPSDSNRTIYIEGGAVVKGSIHADNASGLQIRGQGILLYDDSVGSKPTVNFREPPLTIAHSQNVSVNDLIIVESTTRFGKNGAGPNAPWAVHFAQDSVLRVSNLKVLSELRDGMDVDGSQQVHVSNSFIQSGDDAFCIKSTPYGISGGNKNVEGVVFDSSEIFATISGSALEIGTELFAPEVHDIHFSHLDIIDTFGVSKPITIKNGGPADVHDISFEDIQIDGRAPYGPFEFSIAPIPGIPSPHPGTISNVKLKDIHLTDGNPLPSKVADMDDQHKVSGVEFSNLTFGNTKVASKEQAKVAVGSAQNRGLIFK